MKQCGIKGPGFKYRARYTLIKAVVLARLLPTLGTQGSNPGFSKFLIYFFSQPLVSYVGKWYSLPLFHPGFESHAHHLFPFKVKFCTIPACHCNVKWTKINVKEAVIGAHCTTSWYSPVNRQIFRVGYQVWLKRGMASAFKCKLLLIPSVTR